MAKLIEVVLYCIDGTETVIKEEDEVTALVKEDVRSAENKLVTFELDQIKSFCLQQPEGAFQIKSAVRKEYEAPNEWEAAKEPGTWLVGNNVVFVRSIINVLEVTDEEDMEKNQP